MVIEPASIASSRLTLTPLGVADAADMHSVLADPEMYRYTGGEPPTIEELERRYEFQTRGDPIGKEIWLNWVVRHGPDSTAIGLMQATVAESAAELAWIIGVASQGRGFASEAAAMMRDHLAAQGIEAFRAAIHPDHVASQRVAQSMGFVATDEMVDGEVVWVNGPAS